MTRDFNRYLENTTIFEYKIDNNKGSIFYRNQYYQTIQIDEIDYFSNQSFLKFIDSILESLEININDNFRIYLKESFGGFSSEIAEKVRSIYVCIITKYSQKKEEYALYSTFKNGRSFLENFIFDSNYTYTHTDAENFYNAIGSENINNIFRGRGNIKKIRQTRNKFIEHKEEFGERRAYFISGGDSKIGKIHMKIFIASENREYQFSICPLLDFCMFINEILNPIS